MRPPSYQPKTARAQQALDRLKATLAANRAWEEARSVLHPPSNQNPLPPDEWSLWPVRVARWCLEDKAYLRAMQKMVSTPITLPSQARIQDAGFNPSEPRDKAGKWTSGGGSGGTAHTSHAPSLQQAVLKETGNAYGDKGRFNRITYADTDRAFHLQTAPYIPHSQAKLVNAGLGGMVTSPVARRLESYVWEIAVAELMKTQLWSDIRKRWQDWQKGRDLSLPHQNTVANQNDPTASPSKDEAGKGAKKGEAQGQASAGMPSPEEPNDPNHKKKGNGDQTSNPDQTPKPEPDSGPRPPWENEDGELKGELNEKGTILTICVSDGEELEKAALDFMKKLAEWLKARGITRVSKQKTPLGNKKGFFELERYSDKSTLSYRSDGQSSWRTNGTTVDANNNQELMKFSNGNDKRFKFKFKECEGK